MSLTVPTPAAGGQLPSSTRKEDLRSRPTACGFAFCDKTGRLALWDIPSAKVVWQHDLPGVVYHLAFAPDGRHLLTANSNGTLYVLRMASPQPAAKVLKGGTP